MVTLADEEHQIVRQRDAVEAADWEFDFSVEEGDGEYVVQDAEGRFVCSCNTEDNALSVAGALNQTWMGHALAAEDA